MKLEALIIAASLIIVKGQFDLRGFEPSRFKCFGPLCEYNEYYYYDKETLTLLCYSDVGKAYWNSQNKLTNSQIVDESSEKLYTTLVREDNEKSLKCSFNGHGQISDKLITFKLVERVSESFIFSGFDEKRLKYLGDDKYVYSYFDNEDLNLKCRKTNENSNGNTFWYLSTNPQMQNNNIRVNALMTDDKRRMTCVYRGTNNQFGEKTIKMRLETNVANMFHFTGFDEKRLKDVDNNQYEYYFNDKELLHLNCYKVYDKLNGNTYWTFCNIHIQKPQSETSPHFETILTEKFDQKQIMCHFDSPTYGYLHKYIRLIYSPDTVPAATTASIPVSSELCTEPDIALSNIQHYSCSKPNFFVTGFQEDVSVTKAESKNCVFDVTFTQTPYKLKLTCHRDMGVKIFPPQQHLTWIYNDETNAKDQTCVYTNNTIEKEIQLSNKETVLTCITGPKKKEITNERIVFNFHYVPATIAPDPVEDTKNIYNGTDENNGSNLWHSMDLWYGVGALICVILLILVICVVRKLIQRQKVITRVNSDVTYENFGEDKHEQFPPNLETAYARPFDSLSIKENTYATPHVDIYSKPIPKSQRIDQMYSKVLPKNRRNKTESPYAKIKKSNNLVYAEIDSNTNEKGFKKKDEPAYSEIKKADYENFKGYTNVPIFNSGKPYANTSSNVEYVEPAYCELNKTNK